MYLKSIEINGFKSFANKIKFEFPHGITGIVGPNGSGKSNIADAVRWVLGEQSAKQLRGSRMEDVIFSGTESRKPMGFAYVAITFDNQDRKIPLDYNEVKVARRVYRSGESEYLINGSSCRRRDIVEVFYDTGIGKEGYSIIGQGQVEKILSGKIEDSRELFDEAAGIAKHKKNRTLTERNLEQERNNLSRVTDILSELEKQVGPLERQSKKARVYLNLKDREKEVDRKLFLYDYTRYHEKKTETRHHYEIIQEDLNRTVGEYEQKKQENQEILSEAERLSRDFESLEHSRDEYNSRKNAADARIVERKHTMDKNLLSIDHCNDNKTRQEEIKKEKEAQLSSLLVHLEEERLALADYKDALQILEVDYSKRQAQKAGLEGTLLTKQETLYDFLHSATDVKEKLGRYDALEEQLKIRNAEYNSRLVSLNTDLGNYIKKTRELEQELEAAHGSWEECSRSYNRLLEENSKKKAEYAALNKALDQDRQSVLRMRSRCDTLVSINERYEGYNKSIQHIMEQKKNYPDIIGVVADILSMDKEYETAIEIALGGALQNIVTENEQVAKEMILYLKKKRFGRATFLPLPSIRKRNAGINPAIFEEEGVIGTASSLVHTEKRFANLKESLLGRTIVADTIDHALILSRKYNYSLRIVTIGGELLNPGGSITGGAYRSSGSLLGRNREIEEIRADLRSMTEQLNRKKAKQEAIGAEIAGQQETLDKKKGILDQLVLDLHDYNTQLPELRDKEEELKKQIHVLKDDHKALLAQLKEIRQKKDELARSQQDSEKLHEENHDAIARLEQELGTMQEAISGLEEQKNQKILEISQCEQQISFFQNELSRLQTEIQDCTDSIRESVRQAERLHQENEEIKDSLTRQQTDLEEWNQRIRKVSEQLEENKTRRRRLNEKQNKSYEGLQALNEQLRFLEKEENRLSTALEKYTDSLDSIVNYMWDTYEITYNRALEDGQELIKDAEAGICRKEKKELAHQIRQLGAVNVNSIEEYKEVGARYSQMKQQYEDIKESEAELMEIIADLNQAMCRQFTNRFSEIQQMFSVVFRDLFEGGSASLELMDPKDILECGIRIVAQPPGKKLQNILLLSGGEKALTAIALLFAIQNLKPSPFCLLDEIEAALDDANIMRFAKYLRKLSKDTQFIVITHRRGTMTAADSLYGITMQEKGISALISVDLIDKQLT